ncbi:MAG: NAD(P)H-hydrate dehydratase [Desulfovibrionaceae bacterium]
MRLFDPLPLPEEMARWDRWAIEELGMRGESLMDNAAREALAVLRTELGDPAGRRVLCFAGPGNNGGDAFALARHLADAGAEVRVLHTRPKKHYRGHARHHLELARKLDLRLDHLDATTATGPDSAALPPALLEVNGAPPDVVVDGLLGTGFAGELREDMLALVRAVNHLGRRAYVLALDIPSGLCGRTGRPLPEAVRATATATFHAAKVGLLAPEAAPWVGRLFVRPIGIPALAEALFPPARMVITQGIMTLNAPPAPDLHKGAAGRVLVAGGSPGLTGAPHLAGLAALRAGAGLARLACPAPWAAEAKGGLAELMTLPLASPAWDRAAGRELAAALPGWDALVLGPGLGRDRGAGAFLAELFETANPLPLPLVLDADALFHVAAGAAPLPAGAVITPHPGEMARLLGCSVAEVQADRFGAASDYARRHGVTVVLKGPGTWVAAPGGTGHLCPLAAPNLATGGTGDVLAGMLGALLARGLGPLQSACLAVYWHALAGRLMAGEHPTRGTLAGEIAHALPRTAKEYTCRPPRTS